MSGVGWGGVQTVGLHQACRWVAGWWGWGVVVTDWKVRVQSRERKCVFMSVCACVHACLRAYASAAVSPKVLCTPCNYAPVYSVTLFEVTYLGFMSVQL